MLSTTSNPLVSIIIPSYNHERYIKEAIKSVFFQTYRNIELIIIDDGSTDSSKNIIENIINDSKGKNCKFIVQSNIGLSATLNKGIRISSGKYIGFLASDDAYLPNKIKENVFFLEEASSCIGAVYSDGYLINSQGDCIGRFSAKYPVPISRNIYKELLIENWIAFHSILFKKECVVSIGGFDENFEMEDYDFLMRFSGKFEIVRTNKVLFFYRLHDKNTINDRKKMSEQRDKLMKKHCEMFDAINFVDAVKSKSFYKLIKHVSCFNLDHAFRRIIKKIQRKMNFYDC